MRISDGVVHGIATVIDVTIDVLEELTRFSRTLCLFRPHIKVKTPSRVPDELDVLSAQIRRLREKTELVRNKLRESTASRRDLNARLQKTLERV